MKVDLPKVLTNMGFIFLVIGLLFSGFAPSKVYAADLELIGSEMGLEILSETERLFNLGNLKPGDTVEANLTIKNKYIAPFELFMKTERISEIPKEGDADLFKQLLLTVYLGDREIYSGSMAGFAASNITLGMFNLNDTMKLRAIVHLPGPESGNEFQGKNVDVKWIFTAQAGELEPEEPKPEDPEDPGDPNLPKTGEVTPMLFFGIGSGLIGLGIGVRRKKKE